MSRNLFIIVLLIITPFCGWGQVDTIADQKLQEVVIMAKLPTVEMKPGKMTYRLDASITQSQGNVYDVLTSLPGVVIQNDGTIFLNGQNGANILGDRADDAIFLSNLEEYIKLLSFRDRLSNVG